MKHFFFIGGIGVAVAIGALFAYPVIRELFTHEKAPALTDGTTFRGTPPLLASGEVASAVYRVGVVPKDFPREFLPGAYFPPSAKRLSFPTGEEHLAVSFATPLTMAELLQFYAAAFTGGVWVEETRQESLALVSLRAVGDDATAMHIILRQSDGDKRRVDMAYITHR